MKVLGLALLLALLVFAVRRVLAGYPAPSAPLRRLTRGEWAFVESAADALYPPGGAVPPSGREAGVAAWVDRYLDALPPRMRALMRCLFLLVEHATLLFPGPGAGGRRRFSALAPAQRAAVLEDWRSSRLFPRRLVFTSLRAILTLGYFADPAVLRALRLAPYTIETPVCEADLLWPPAGRPRSALRYGPADLSPPGALPPLGPDGPLHPDYAPASGERA